VLNVKKCMCWYSSIITLVSVSKMTGHHILEHSNLDAHLH